MNDEQQIERFRLLFEREHAVVYRFLHGMTGNADTARELTQETFFRAFRAFGSFASRSAPSTWLCGIARNVALNDIRARKPLAPVETIGEATGASPQRELLSRELREAIRRALLTLDEEKRVAFTLKVIEQKSYEEIAAITGAAIGKLKTDVHRARLQMRSLLSEFAEEGP